MKSSTYPGQSQFRRLLHKAGISLQQAQGLTDNKACAIHFTPCGYLILHASMMRAGWSGMVLLPGKEEVAAFGTLAETTDFLVLRFHDLFPAHTWNEECRPLQGLMPRRDRK